MADESLYDLAGRKEETKERADEEEMFKQMKVVSLDDRKRVKCESCVRDECPWSDVSSWFDESSWSKCHERARQLYERVAVFLCFVCEMYVCAKCLPKHRGHDGMKVGRMRERLYAKKLWDDVMNESETESEEKFKTNKVSIIDRVKVKHEMDQTNCWITGFCGLENKRLVVCDWCNSYIKIFKLGSHVIQRYIRVVGPDSGPRDVTEIDLKQNSTEPNLVSGSSPDISGTDRADPDKQCLIAVTLPEKRQIMFIDLSEKPAKAQKIIHTEKECYSIQFYDDKIFTGCRENPDSPWYVYIYSTDGDRLNKFDTVIYGYIPGPYLAVVSGRVYLTDEDNHKVQCRNVEGQLISEIKIEWSRPEGISVDPDNNVYVCALWHNKVYKLDADLTRYMSVLDQTTDYIGIPRALCYSRDKLFIGHNVSSSLRNFVTVVRLL